MKRRTEAGNMVVNRRLKGLALITGMVLLFSSGISVAAGTDFKLFHKPAAAEKFVELTHLSDSEKTESGAWLKDLTKDADVISFVTKYATEPIKFVEAVKEAFKAVGDDATAKETFKTDLKKAFDKVAPELFGSTLSKRKLALMDLVDQLLKSSDLNKDELLKDLFTADMIAELGLKTELPTEVAEAVATKTGEPAAEKEKEKSLLERITEIKDEFLKKLAESGKTPPATDSTARPAVDVGTTPGGAVPGAVPGALPQGGARAVGEQNNAINEKLVTQICDLKAAQDAAALAGEQKLLAVSDGLNNLLNQEAIRNRFNQNQNKKNDGLEAAAAAIAQSLNDNGKQQNAVAQAPQPVQPPQQAQNNRRNDDQQPLPLPTPDQQQPPQQNQPAPFMVPQLGNNTPVRVATGRLPISSAVNELDRVETIANNLENRQSSLKQIALMGPNVPSAALVEPISKLDSEINRAQSALKIANDKAKNLDRDLERVKEGGRKALAETDLRKEKQLQLEFQEKKDAFEQEKQAIQQQVGQVQQSGGDAAAYSQQANQYLTQKSQELAQAKKLKDTFEGELELKVESLNGEIKALAAQRDDLKAGAATIEGQLATLKSEQSQLTQRYSEAYQRELSGPVAGLAGGATGFSNNASKIVGYRGANSGGAPTLPGRLQRGTPANLPTGNAGRGMFGGKAQ